MEPVSFRNDSDRWTDWGWPPRRTTTCPACGNTVPRLYSEGTDTRPAAHLCEATATRVTIGAAR